jgi:hypothetical protein
MQCYLIECGCETQRCSCTQASSAPEFAAALAAFAASVARMERTDWARILFLGCAGDLVPNRCGLELAGEAYDGVEQKNHEVGHEPVEAEDAQHAREVVAERHQAPLAAHLVEATHEEMAVAGATFERAERMLHQACAAAHQRAGSLHPLPMPFDDVLVHPPKDLARRPLVSDTAPAQGARITGGFSAHITDIEPAAGVFLQATRRP